MIKNLTCLICILLLVTAPLVAAEEQDLDVETTLLLFGAACLMASQIDPKCEQLAQAMGSLWGTEEHIDGMKEYLADSCHTGVSMSCGLLGAAYGGGSILMKDLWASELYTSLGCDLQNSMSCFNLGKIYFNGLGVKKDVDKASELFTKSCDLGHTPACNFPR